MTNAKSASGGSVSLRPKARILKVLGEELISSNVIALIELVKNSYDADASTVLIEFDGELQKGKGAIAVYDNGHGMDRKTVDESWMVIATTAKRKTPRSKSGKRRLVGEKGIGRFATSRLASQLELISRVETNQKEIYAFFDWTQFDDDERFLDEIEFLIEERPAEKVVSDWPLSKLASTATTEKGALSGTILKMTSLKHSWEARDFEMMQRGLSRLIAPFDVNNEFEIFVNLPEPFQSYSRKVEAPEIIKYPHYTVRGDVDAVGRYRFSVIIESDAEQSVCEGYYFRHYTAGTSTVISSEYPIEEMDDDDDTYKSLKCGPLAFELRVWDRDELENVLQKVGGGIRAVRKELDAVAGINLYRDDFRVLPYGEPDNDWLRLDLRRVQNPTKRLSNNQITGYIKISADENAELHDRSNREGLDNNTAYRDLQDIMILVLTELESRRYVARRPEKASRHGEDLSQSLFAPPSFEEVKAAIDTKTVDKKKALGLLSKAEDGWKKQIKKFQNVLSQYHALATLGSIVDKILHDGRQPLAIIQTEAGLGRERAEKTHLAIRETSSVIEKDLERIQGGFGRITNQSNILRDVFNRVEPFGGRKRGRPKKYYIEDVIKNVFDLYERELSEAGIKADLPSTETLVSIDITELSEIFMNLITNSLYWLGRVPKSKRSISVQIERRADGALEILFADSGPGIDRKYKDRVFEPYFSTKPEGHGLGLSLIGEIVKDYYNGNVELMDSGKKGGTIFRLLLRRRV